ncbi:unnamed protein product [Cylindrotheca closterium]|uniref:J domain-containing protein n=1 Tax=Cylindrotheca closterium TaxID=2856 RepID=A0AAD2GDA5_9STRA|nr:unnamed protein product [Cylindrotheca closterium]
MEHRHHHQYPHYYPNHYQQYHHYNLYSILGLPCYTSDEAEIGKAFLKQSQMYHPSNPNNGADPARSLQWFQTIEHAYDILKDPNSKKDYDKFLVASTQHDFNRSRREAAKQQQQHHSYLSSWMTSWDRKQDEADSKHCLSVCLQREKLCLQNQLEANQQAFYRRERGYVNRIRSLESTVASLRRKLEEHKDEKDKETNDDTTWSDKSTFAVDNTTPTSSNLTTLMVVAATKPRIAMDKNETLKQQHQQQIGSTTISRINTKRPAYHIMPSLMDKENLDDACKIHVKRVKQRDHRHHQESRTSSPSKQQKCSRKEFGVVAISPNCR